MSKAYIVGAHVPHGGTYMAYHVGLCASRVFDLEPVAVQVGDESPEQSSFTYERELDTVTIEQLPSLSTNDDLLVVNPSFSRHLLGLNARGRKICYVQHFNTYAVLDGFFDLYVSVSEPVQHFLSLIYRIETPVIPPFIEHTDATLGEKIDRFLMGRKSLAITRPLLDRLAARYSHEYGEAMPDIDIPAETIPHHEWLRQMHRYRYFLTLCPCEGFGLMPLEAMAAGCVVAGFDGIGGRDYLHDGVNSKVTTYPDVDGLADRIRSLVRMVPHDRDALTSKARDTASRFSRDTFYTRWTELLQARASRLSF